MPLPLVNIAVAAIAHDFVLTQWVVQGIAFTPETYELHYRPAAAEDDISTVMTTSGDDFTQRNTIHTVVVDTLEPGTPYVFFVRITNSEGTTMSEHGSFLTRASGTYINDNSVLAVKYSFCIVRL